MNPRTAFAAGNGASLAPSDFGDSHSTPGLRPRRRRLCVVLHDVTPACWAECLRVVAHVQHVAHLAERPIPMTLLLVPRWHGDGTTPELYIQWLRQLEQQGHQLALHGQTHLDDKPLKGPLDFWRRRVMTDGEGEFAALTRREAWLRMRDGRAWAEHHGLKLSGFVPPAWLLNASGWKALRHSGFDHTCTPDRIMALPSGRALPAPALMFSTRSAARRVASRWWNAAMALRWRDAPLVRLDLHPHDADYPPLLAFWSRWLLEAVQSRKAVRVADVARGLG